MTKIKGTNVTIMVKDMDTSISFYESIGLTLKTRWGDYYAMVTAEGITLGIHPARDNELSSGTVSIGFMIEKIEEATEMLKEKNIEYATGEDPGGLYLYFRDPDGTQLYFIQLKQNY